MGGVFLGASDIGKYSVPSMSFGGKILKGEENKGGKRGNRKEKGGKKKRKWEVKG
jgi:hypothetical protein